MIINKYNNNERNLCGVLMNSTLLMFCQDHIRQWVIKGWAERGLSGRWSVGVHDPFPRANHVLCAEEKEH